jgi:hypothetical protein
MGVLFNRRILQVPRVSLWLDGITKPYPLPSPKSHVQQPLSPHSLSFLFSFFSLPLIHAHFSPFLFSFIFSLSSHRHPYTHERETETEVREQIVRERESCCLEEEEGEGKRGFLESSVQSASTASINVHPWSDGAEIW